VNDQPSRSARLRYTATGALAALLAAGAIVGTSALAAKPSAKAPAPATRRALAAKADALKTPGAPIPDKASAPKPSANPQPFLDDVQRLVDNGTITAAERLVVDREIEAGRVDTDSLTAAGFTPTQLQAVQQALDNTKRGLAAAAHSTSK
jgi:hypothetical protein